MKNNAINFMIRALELAQKGEATVSPNPLVGSVIVKNGKIIGEGFHVRKGEAHAEVNAINNASESVEGSTLYCTLEPCCHTNKTTPPCTELIIEKKIKKVVVATLDPNPNVAGKGMERLRSFGIETVSGLLEEKALKQNKIFFKNMNEARPYIHLKAAITLDGRIATSTGDSRWISSPAARDEVHLMRARYDAVMIGKNTLKADNPKLNARTGLEVVKENKKIIVGSLESEDLKLDLFKDPSKVINISKTKSAGDFVQIIKEESWDLTLKELYKEGVNSILVEGGSKLLSSFLEEDLYDEATFYLVPKIIGNGPSVFDSSKAKKITDGLELKGSWRINSANEAVFEVTK